MQTPTLPAAIAARVKVTEDGCWRIGTGYGYAELRHPETGTRAYAHRLAAEAAFGPCPDGMVVDHKCHNADPDCNDPATCLHRRCINPAHLRYVGRGDNTISSPHSVTGINARKTHCIHGHPLFGANLRIYTDRHGNTRRICIACCAERNARFTQAQRGAA